MSAGAGGVVSDSRERNTQISRRAFRVVETGIQIAPWYWLMAVACQKWKKPGLF